LSSRGTIAASMAAISASAISAAAVPIVVMLMSVPLLEVLSKEVLLNPVLLIAVLLMHAPLTEQTATVRIPKNDTFILAFAGSGSLGDGAEGIYKGVAELTYNDTITNSIQFRMMGNSNPCLYSSRTITVVRFKPRGWRLDHSILVLLPLQMPGA